MTPEEYCQDKATRRGSSLYYSLLFLPETQRRAATALYAYQREIDDTVAECSDIGVAQTKLQWWQEEIARLFAHCPRHPVTQALADPVKNYKLSQESFLHVIEGANRDLGQSSYPSFQVLASYCYQVAGNINLMTTEVYGYQDRSTQKYAEDLGVALQLTHILRSLRQDADRGRIYLPQDELTRFKVTREDLLTRNGETEGMRALFAHQASRARQYFCRALSDLHTHDRYSQRAGLAQAAIQLKTLEAMEEDGYQMLQQQVSLTPLRKLWIAWLTTRRAQRGQIPPC